jgi:hypothetical protein
MGERLFLLYDRLHVIDQFVDSPIDAESSAGIGGFLCLDARFTKERIIVSSTKGILTPQPDGRVGLEEYATIQRPALAVVHGVTVDRSLVFAHDFHETGFWIWVATRRATLQGFENQEGHAVSFPYEVYVLRRSLLPWAIALLSGASLGLSFLMPGSPGVHLLSG